MNKKYKAFISYSHQDKKWGDWLHKTLESYKVPKALIGKQNRNGKVPNKLFPIFRDREELPTATNLGAVITNALEESSYLIVICSPRSAKSMWVNQEILSFKRMGKENRVLAIIVDGEPNGTNKPELGLEECFPEALKFNLNDDGELSDIPSEPIAADARVGKDGKRNALLKLTAGLLGVNYDDLKQREKRRQKQKRIMFAVTASLLILTGYFYIQYAKQLNNEKLIAQSKSLASESQSFLKSGDSKKAIQTALKALPRDLSNPSRPYVSEAEVALSQAVYKHKELYSFQAHKGKLATTDTSSNNKYIATGGEDWKVKVWDASNQNLIKELAGHKAPIRSVKYHPTRDLLVSWDASNQFIIWNTKSWSIDSQFYVHGSIYKRSILFSIDNKHLVVNDFVWDLDNKSEINLDYLTKGGSINNILPIKGTENHIVFHDGYISKVNFNEKRHMSSMLFKEFKKLGDLRDIILLNDKKTLIVNFEYKRYLINFKDLSVLNEINVSFTKILSYLNDTQEILYFHKNNFYLWKVVDGATRKANNKIEDLYISKTDMSVLKNNQRRVVFIDDSEVKILDVVSGNIITTFSSGIATKNDTSLFGQTEVILDVSFNNDSSLLNMSLIDGRLKVFDASSLNENISLKLSAKVKSFKRSHNNKYIVVYLENNNIELIDVEKKQIKKIATNFNLKDLTFALDDKQLILLSDNFAKIFNTENSQEMKTLTPFQGVSNLKPQISVSRSQQKIGFYSVNDQQAVYDLVNNSWVKPHVSSNIQSSSNLQQKWMLKGGGITATNIDSDLKIISEKHIANKTLTPLSVSEAVFSNNMEKVIWVNSDDVEFWDVANAKELYRYKINPFESYTYTDISRSGSTALIGNMENIKVIPADKNKPSLRFPPRNGSDSYFLIAFMDSNNTISIIENLFQDKNAVSIIYQLDIKNNKVIWQSKPVTGHLNVLKIANDSVLLSNANNSFIYYRNKRLVERLNPAIKNNQKSIVKFSPDNSKYLTLREGELTLWDITSKDYIWSIKNKLESETHFSTDGQYLAITYNSLRSLRFGSIKIINTETGKELAHNYRHRGQVFGFNNANELITWQSASAVCRWNWGKSPKLLYGHDLSNSAECVPQVYNNGWVHIDGDKLIVLNNTSKYELHDSITRNKLASITCDSSTTFLPVNNESQSTACISMPEGVQFYNTSKLTEFSPFNKNMTFSNIQASSNGRFYVAIEKNGDVLVSDINNLSLVTKVFSNKNISHVNISNSGKYLIIIEKNWKAEVWDIDNKKLIDSIQLQESQLNYLGGGDLYLSDDKQALMIFDSGEVYTWKSDLKNKITHFKLAMGTLSHPIKINFNHKRIIQSDYNNIIIWDWNKGVKVKEYAHNDYLVKNNLQVHEGSENLIINLSNKTLVLNLLTGKELLNIKSQSPKSFVISPSLKYMAVVEKNNSSSWQPNINISIWDIIKLEKVSSVGLSKLPYNLIFSPDSKQLAELTNQGLVKIWDISFSKAKLSEIYGLNGLDKDWIVRISNVWPVSSTYIYSPGIGMPVTVLPPPRTDQGYSRKLKINSKTSPDGKYLVSKESESSLNVFNLNTFALQFLLSGFNGGLIDFVFQDDNKKILTLSDKGIIQAWSLKDGKELYSLSDKPNDNMDTRYIGFTFSGDTDLITYSDEGISVWDIKKQMKLGELNVSKSILTLVLSSQSRYLTLLDDSGTVNFIPLEPKGQKLIDKAFSLVN